jgi:hypothetical protein
MLLVSASWFARADVLLLAPSPPRKGRVMPMAFPGAEHGWGVGELGKVSG